MKLSWQFCVWVSLVGLGIAGCSKNASSIGSGHAQLFQTADPLVKAQWDSASAAIQTNGFVAAITTLKQLQQASLTPEQLAAVNATASAVNNEMYDAANKGDAGAKEAIAKLRQLYSR